MQGLNLMVDFSQIHRFLCENLQILVEIHGFQAKIRGFSSKLEKILISLSSFKRTTSRNQFLLKICRFIC